MPRITHHDLVMTVLSGDILRMLDAVRRYLVHFPDLVLGESKSPGIA